MDFSSPLPVKGIAIPIYVTTAGIKGVPFLSFGKNGFSPALRLFENEIEYKLFRIHRRSYQEIECVDTLSRNASRHLIFNWKESRWTFHAMVIREDWLVEVLQFLQLKNVTLSGKAQSVLNLKMS